jgi:hypothetical protein
LDWWVGTPFKGQLHCHTTNSDGAATPTQIVTNYKNAGYDFVSITDHDVNTADPGVTGITFIPGVEETESYHIVAWDATTQTASTDIPTIIDFHTNLGRMTEIAHPNWSGTLVTVEHMITYYANGYRFTEAYNANTNTNGEDKWDAALSSGNLVYGTAVDDCHTDNGSDFNKGWVVVYATSNSKADILAAIEAGNFYASTGNDIAVKKVSNVIYAASSWFSDIEFIGDNGVVLATANGTCRASYTLAGTETYIRVKSTRVYDSKIAWSQPIML